MKTFHKNILSLCLILVGGLLLYCVLWYWRELTSREIRNQTTQMTGEQLPTSQVLAHNPKSTSDIEKKRFELLRCPADIATMSRARVIEAAQLQFMKFLTDGTSGVLDGQPRNRTRTYEAWRYLMAELKEELVSDISPGVLAGRMLPTAIRNAENPRTAFSEVLISGEIPFLSTNEQVYQAAILHSVGLWAGVLSGNDISAFFKERANQMPPTKSDLFAYFALRDGINEIGTGSSHDHPTIESIAPYAKAKNPIYRLLALEAIAVALPVGIVNTPAREGSESIAIARARIPILHLYASEEDPIIVNKLINVLGPMPLPEAASILKSIRDQQTRLGADEVVRRATEAIALVESRIKKFAQKP